MKRLLLLIAVCVAVSLAYLKAYEVTPTQATWSGKVDGDPEYGGVGNTFVANFDSICYCDVFIGHVGDTSHHYYVDVYEYPNGAHVALSDGKRGQDHHWLNLPLTTISGQRFMRGKEYLLKVTRLNAGLDSEHSQSTMS